MRAESEAKTGSLAYPFSLTPFLVGSIRKCLTSSSGSEGVEPSGGIDTLSASPNAPGKLFESRTRKEPGEAFFKAETASSREMVGLYHSL